MTPSKNLVITTEAKLDVKTYVNWCKVMIVWILVASLQWFVHLRIIDLGNLSTYHILPKFVAIILIKIVGFVEIN